MPQLFPTETLMRKHLSFGTEIIILSSANVWMIMEGTEMYLL